MPQQAGSQVQLEALADPGRRVIGVISARDALPREVDTATGLAEFDEQVVDDAAGQTARAGQGFPTRQIQQARSPAPPPPSIITP